jgi:hypothetical protein
LQLDLQGLPAGLYLLDAGVGTQAARIVLR